MLTWQLDRFLRAGPLCALATFAIPAALAVLVDRTSDIENVLGIVLLASLIMFLGSLFGSIVATGMGALLFGIGTAVAELPGWVTSTVGVGLFATLVVHDLAGSFRRAPKINPWLWRAAAVVIVLVGAASASVFAITYLVATLATWQTVVVPFGIAAIGFAAKLAADSHATSAKQLTAKRTKQPADSPS